LRPKTILPGLPEAFVTTPELSSAVSRGVLEGILRSLAPRVYTKNLDDPAETIIRRHLWELVSGLVPGALIADRTVLELRPAHDGSIFVVSDRKRDIKLPGLVIRSRKGPPALPDSDRAFIGTLFISSPARAYLDNMAASRQSGDRARRTMTREELEANLDHAIRSQGGDALNKIRDQARAIAPRIGREAELVAFDRLLSSLLGTHDAPLLTAHGRARQAGMPYDPDRLLLFETLYKELRATAPVSRLARDHGPAGRTNLAFFEAYFSNFIEGTKFAVDEAADIIFHNVIPQSRPADAHDIAGTWRIVSDPTEMSTTPADPASLLQLLKRRHAVVMTGRPEKRPGAFKLETNQSGSTVFVAPDLVEGTLIKGFDLYRSLDTPFARAVYLMLLITEVHPFTDGNGRTARIMMNAELVASAEERILIPTVLRDSYISALKALSGAKNPQPLVRVLNYAQRWVAAVHWGELQQTRAALERCNAFLESSEAEERGLSLRFPEHAAPGAGS